MNHINKINVIKK